MKNDNGHRRDIQAEMGIVTVKNCQCPPSTGAGALQQKAVCEGLLNNPMLPNIPSIREADELQNRCAMAAFGGMPLLNKIKLLIEFAARRHSCDTHWPLPSLVFNELSSLDSVEELDMDAISSAIIGAYRIRLTPKHRIHMRENSFGNGFEVLERCTQDWQLRVLEHTAGQLELTREASRQQLTRWFSTVPAPPFNLAMDFRQGSVVNKADFQSSTVVDPMGACCLDTKLHPRIVLFIRRIVQCARETGMDRRLKEFCLVALVDELTHLARLGIDGFSMFDPANPRNPQSWMEALAIHNTWIHYPENEKRM